MAVLYSIQLVGFRISADTDRTRTLHGAGRRQTGAASINVTATLAPGYKPPRFWLRSLNDFLARKLTTSTGKFTGHLTCFRESLGRDRESFRLFPVILDDIGKVYGFFLVI